MRGASNVCIESFPTAHRSPLAALPLRRRVSSCALQARVGAWPSLNGCGGAWCRILTRCQYYYQ